MLCKNLALGDKKIIKPIFLPKESKTPILLRIYSFIFLIRVIYWIISKFPFFITIKLLLVILSCIFWWNNIKWESNYSRRLTVKKINSILRLAIIIFILSEVVFFITLFMSFLYTVGLDWDVIFTFPPLGIVLFDPFIVPFFNTALLLIRRVTLTAYHEYLINFTKFNNENFEKKSSLLKKSDFIFYRTLILGWIFECIQFIEYKQAIFNINDSFFGTMFFISTGFHGFHVIIGLLFLIYSLFYIKLNNVTCHNDIIRIECRIWYWHFVDTVWLVVLYLFYLIPFYLI